jgi:hypothetical protein
MNPVAFISSFYQEERFKDYYDSPLWRLRRDIYLLKDDDIFSEFQKENPNRDIAWVAEHSEELGTGLKTVDRLVEVLAQSDLYICILADDRHDSPNEHGSPIKITNLVSATSYFEIELYAAVMHQKKPYLFIQEGFSPAPRLEYLLRLLFSAFPEWEREKPKSRDIILREVRQLIFDQIRQPKKFILPLRKYLVREFYIDRAKKASPGHEMDNVLFLDGQFEPRQQLPQKDLVESLLADYEVVPEMQRKLSRMWIAARELMSASYLPKDVQADGRLKDFLPLWQKVLSFWTSAASWSGWHGHLYAGTVAPLNSQAVILSQLGSNLPNEGLASAYYSISKLMPSFYYELAALWRSFQYIQSAIRVSGAPTANQLAIRGSIWLRCRIGFNAVSDFKMMLQIQEKNNATKEQIADAMVHLGFAHLYWFQSATGLDYLKRGVQAMNPNHASIVRAKHKLAIAYERTGKHSEYEKCKQEANADAVRLGAFDQIR